MDEKEFQKMVKKVEMAAKAYSGAVTEMQKAITEKAKLQSNIQSLIPALSKDPSFVDKFAKNQAKLSQLDSKVAQLTQKQQKLHTEFEKAGKELAKAGQLMAKAKKGKK